MRYYDSYRAAEYIRWNRIYDGSRVAVVLLGELQTALYDWQCDHRFFSKFDAAISGDDEYRVAAAAVRNDSTLYHSDT